MKVSELVRIAKNGSSQAWKELVKIYLPTIRAIAEKYFIPGADPEDVVQEGLLGLLKAVNSFDASKNEDFSLFLEMCVKRQIISALRRATRQKDIPLGKQVPLNETLSLALSGNIGDFNFDTFLRSLQFYLSDLEIEILKRYLEGKAYGEIAQELKCSIKTVDNALQRIKRKLRKNFVSL